MFLLWPSLVSAGHETNTPRTFAPRAACLGAEAPTHIIELSHVSPEAVDEFWNQMLVGGECKDIPEGLMFWPDEVVAQLEWSDGDLMYVVRGHDLTGLELHLWMAAEYARRLGVPMPGIEVSPPLMRYNMWREARS